MMSSRTHGVLARPSNSARHSLATPQRPTVPQMASRGHSVIPRAEPSTREKNSRKEVEINEAKDATGGADISDISQAGATALVEEAEVDGHAYRVAWWKPAFTRRREIAMGRVAMIGFLSLQVGEILTGEGLFGQINAWTGIPKPVAAIFLLGIIANNAISAAHPSSVTFSKENQQDISKRNKLGAQQFFSKPGFTKRNELNVGRVAMLGFGAATLGEIISGKGPAGQLGFHMDSPLVRGAGGILLVAWIAFWLVVAKKLGTEGQLKGDTEIY